MAAGPELAQRLATFVTGLLECMGFAGVIFGWASLVFVLKREKYFDGLCIQAENATNISSTVPDCSAQDEQFSLIFTIGSFMNNFVTLPNGYIFDHFGTMVIRLIGIFLYTIATLLIAFSTADTAVLLFPALSLLSAGGIVFLLTNIQVGNLFSAHRSTIITLYNGAFDSSSAVFLLVKILHESGLSLKSVFLFISACSVGHLLRTFFLMPRKNIPYPLPEGFSYGVHCGKAAAYRVSEDPSKSSTADSNLKVDTQAGEKLLDKGTELSGPSFWRCVFSWLFGLHLVWLSVMQLRHYLFIGMLNATLNHLARGDIATISRYTDAFAFTQLCGVLCAPWNGIIMDRHKRGKVQESDSLADLQSSILSLAVTVVQCVLFSVCAAIPILTVQYATFIFQVLNRSFLYGGNAAFVAIAFPPAHFGKLYGLVMTLSALVALLQYPCFTLVKDALHGDPFYVNVGFLIFILLAFAHPINVFLECRRRRRSRPGEGHRFAPVLSEEENQLQDESRL
ncbi:solute carrier family 43 member 3 [Rhinatrema bivittatum]|uniref:solute carrier family 43 member 3 n=1 Tax=Rhinatrema bivittatum TaxID=194408 RepID=UPI0011296E8D|nr:solute carrier family 43 member 3 [Rhinatrema bivittatum]XP_029430688.1 solute carrier family 43 member 3 [Rhinatrema bivittatum]XP_029430689.1 solute carrier family 43 member 3 [Rhinatrema bivittatum]